MQLHCKRNCKINKVNKIEFCDSIEMYRVDTVPITYSLGECCAGLALDLIALHHGLAGDVGDNIAISAVYTAINLIWDRILRPTHKVSSCQIKFSLGACLCVCVYV